MAGKTANPSFRGVKLWRLVGLVLLIAAMLATAVPVEAAVGEFSVTYDGNGSTGGDAPLADWYDAGQTATAADGGSLVRTGFTFLGWSSDQYSTEPQYTEGATFTMPPNDLTLYAVWEENPMYEVTFYVLGNVGGTIEAEVDGLPITSEDLIERGKTIVFRWEANYGYAVDGVGESYSPDTKWDMSDEENGSITCTYLGSDISVNVSFYYAGPTYTVTYDANGGSGDPPAPSTSYASGATVTVLANSFTRTGYTFVKWNTEADGWGTDYYPDYDEFEIDDWDVTLYAIWEEDSTPAASLLVFGANSSGQLGDGTDTARYTPTLLAEDPDNPWQAVSAGSDHTLALKADGTLWAWGDNGNGELGNGTYTGSLIPIPIDGSGYSWLAISAGYSSSMAIRSDGTLWAWGRNNYGKLGVGDLLDRSTPTQVGTDPDWSSVSAGMYHTLALKTNGGLWAWGNNEFGQLGDGTTANTCAPKQVGEATDWAAASAGKNHSLGIREDGTLWAWGSCNAGQLGTGYTEDKHIPFCISTDMWLDIATSDEFSLAVKADGTLWGWGSNDLGQLGLGFTSYQESDRRQAGTDTDWAKLGTVRWYHCAALKSDGSLYTWGWNGSGQLGDGTTTNASTPTKVGASWNWLAVSCGGSHSAGIATPATAPTTRTVTFSVVGDSGGTLVATVDSAELTSPAEVEASKTVIFTATPASGYKVNGWTYDWTMPGWDDTGWPSVLAYIDLDSDLTVQVEFEPAFYVTYDANDADSGTVPVDNNAYAEGGEVIVLGNTGNLVKSGYTYGGWSYGGTTYAAGDKLTMPAANVTFSAVWNAVTPTTYTVTFATNPAGVNALVTWEYGTGDGESGELRTGGAPSIDVPAGATLNYRYWSPVTTGGIEYRATGDSPWEGSITVNSTQTVAWDYSTFYEVSLTATDGTDPISAGFSYSIDDGETLVNFTPYDLWVPAGTSMSYTYYDVVWAHEFDIRYKLQSSDPDLTAGVTEPTTVAGVYRRENQVEFRTDPAIAASFTWTATSPSAATLSGAGTADTSAKDIWVPQGWSLSFAFDQTVVRGDKTYVFVDATQASGYTPTGPGTIWGNYALTYTVTFGTTSGSGTVAATVDGNPINTGDAVEAGKNVVFTATPASGYRIDGWSYTESTNWDKTGGPSVYIYTNLNQNICATVGFELIPVAAVVTTHPSDQTITYGQSGSFTAAATGTPTPTVSWQRRTTGDWAYFDPAETTLTLSVVCPTVGYSGTQYRAAFSNSAGTVYTDAATLTVNPAPLSVTADNKTHTYSETAYTGFTVSYADFVLGEDETYLGGTLGYATTPDNPAINVGSYTITPSGYTSSNYAISYNTGTLTISQARPTVNTWPTASGITYGQTLADSNLSGGAASQNTANVPGVFTFDAPTTMPSAGTYSAAVTFTPTDSTNFSTVSSSVDVEVAKKALAITANDQTKVYGETFTFDGDEFATDGLVGTESIASVSLYSAGAVDTAVPGPYDIDISNAVAGTNTDLDNYDISCVKGTLTIPEVTPSTHTVIFVTNPAGVGTDVTWSYGAEPGQSGTTNTGNATPSITVPTGAELTFSFASTVLDGDTKYLYTGASHTSPVTVNSNMTITGEYDTYYLVTFVTDPTGIDANVTYTVGNGTPTVYDEPCWVAAGETLTYEYQDLVNVGDIYTFSYASPPSPQTVTASPTVTGYYCHYDQIFTGKGIGFWNSTPGQRLLQSEMTPEELAALLNSYNLWNENGTRKLFTASSKVYREFGSWVSKATARNMSYMLSAQMASMVLMVEFGEVQSTDMVYAPSLTGDVTLNDFGFIAVEDLIVYANGLLGEDGNNQVGPKHPQRAQFTRVSDVLSWANSSKVLFAAPVCPTMPTCSWVGNWTSYDPCATPIRYSSFSVWSAGNGVAGTWEYWGEFIGSVDGNVLTATITANGSIIELTLTSCDEFVGTFDEETVAGFRGSPPE